MNKKELTSQDMHPILKSTIENLEIYFEDALLASPEVAVIASSRADYSGTNGVPRWSSLRFVYLNEIKFMEWQYVDAYSYSSDRRHLMITGIEKAAAKTIGENLEITVEVRSAKDYPNRTVKHSFPLKDLSLINSSEPISEEELNETKKYFEDEVSRMKDRIVKMWEQNTHTMPTAQGRVPYRHPRIKDMILNETYGIGIFITDEQVDFRLDDPQIKQEAYLVKLNESTRLIHQESAYLSHGSPGITVISIEKDKVILGDERGSLEVKV